MAYKALDIAKKLIFKAQNDEPNGGERLTNLKLQKLLYYQQGFHLAFFGTPLFAEDVEAWMYGLLCLLCMTSILPMVPLPCQRLRSQSPCQRMKKNFSTRYMMPIVSFLP